MNEPRRWLEDPRTPSSLRQVLEAAPEAPAIPRGLQDQVRAYAIGLVSTGLVSKTASAAWAVKSLFFVSGTMTGKVVLFASLMFAAGTSSYLLAGRWHPAAAVLDSRQAQPSVGLTSSVAPIPRSNPANESQIPDDPGGPAAAARTPESKSAKHAERAGRGTENQARAERAGEFRSDESSAPEHERRMQDPRAVASFDAPNIADEAKWLERARLALAGDPALALEIANRHQEFHPDGQLSAEREFIAIDALLRLGRRQEAEQRAAPRLRQSGDSLYARRLRQLLAPKQP